MESRAIKVTVSSPQLDWNEEKSGNPHPKLIALIAEGLYVAGLMLRDSKLGRVELYLN